MTRTLYRNARILTADAPGWVDAMVVDDDRFVFAGADADAPDADHEVDLDGRLVLPGFTDAHTHLLMMGEALGQVGLTDARSLEEIQERLRAARASADGVLRGRGWLFDAVPGGAPTAAMIDAVVADVPVYLDANDYHSCWVNSAALAELGIDRDTPDPIGGRIERDADGEATGMLYETAAQQYAWAHRDATTTDAQRDAAVDRVVEAYLTAGVVGAVDMAFDGLGLAALERAAARGAQPLRIAAHWFVANTGDDEANLAQVAEAASRAAQETAGVRVVGIKLVLDGTIDACTAAMRDPYANGTNAGPIWPAERLLPVVAAADAAGLQVALHAIGDAASTLALDALEHAITVNGDLPRRHRIEHLEYAAPGTAERMARLGVTASMQPVHADPAIFANWAAQLGDERVERAFAWPEYEDAGALLAFSTDAPTAPHEALANMFVAATRASALDRDVAAVHPQFALPLDRAIAHATRDAAASVGDGDWRGRIAPGQAADFVVLADDPFVHGEETLLSTRVVRTVIGGRTVFEV
ncbi:amidohydrolase [Microbacterium sp. GCS4]|uniref:amidohydrolase n=1 Tax=Microbacterium sp. GCS4 TaxID=1692239 RepID=UPI000681740E|nr:amidohydrolase [Microbacterium sp. GCS4]KNY04340.1 amidohydrolase [Microbacterium sp. GCS4]